MQQSYESEMAEAIRECLTKLAAISQTMTKSYAEMEKNVTAADHQLDKALEKADTAQRREIDLTDENQRLREENARLRGEFQIVSDTAHRASMGAQISRNLRAGNEAFPGAHEGRPYRRVLNEAQENARTLEQQYPVDETITLLEKIARSVRGAANLTRSPVDIDRLEREIPTTEATDEVRAAAR